MPLKLYNTLTRQLEPFIPADPARVTFYSCGPTVYDDAHIGNFRSFLAADLLRRWIESPLCKLARSKDDTEGAPGPRQVVHVMNITDVGHMTDDAEGGEQGEDRMAVAGRRIAEAKKSGKLPADSNIDPSNPYQIAEFYAARFIEDAKKLGLKLALEAEKNPALMPRATANVPGMIAVVQKLIERGHAYVVGNPGSRVVYFDVRSFPDYGKLSGNTLDNLKEGEGGRINADNQAQKKHPADFLLWKEDASHIMKWDSPWGKGYPGWHIECTVMSAGSLLGKETFEQLLAGHNATGSVIDLHSGGEDNIFPHHECEIAQSCAVFNADSHHGTFSRMWFHPRFLLVEGTKMSKSKGNFFTARDLFARGIEPAALRLELIKTNYRSNANFTMQGLQDSQRTIERWRKFVDQATAFPAAVATPPANDIAGLFAMEMENDLNIAGAIGAINGWISSRIGSSETVPLNQNDAVIMRIFDGVLGVLSLQKPATAETDIGIFLDGLAPDPAVIAKLEARRTARAAKDFKKSDEIRDELAKMGYAIKDVPGGKVEVRRV